ncbi:MAG: RICIN domain-containing protein, partial [Oscillospiraceae bacterium]|nr:RICIN domain-containing protein [Oscillospiraceae bacterium]
MKRIKSFLAAVMMLAAIPTAPVMTGNAAEAGEYNGTYIIRNVNSGKYLNVDGGETADGTNLQQW